MQFTWLCIVAATVLLADSAEGGVASSARSMALRGNQQTLPESSNVRSGQQSQSRASYLGSSGYGSGKSSKVAEDASKSKSQTKSDRGLGISAWGIVGIIVGIILLSTTGYYTFVLYPYICKKERSYDMVELTNVV